jgi:hypothetical protein
VIKLELKRTKKTLNAIILELIEIRDKFPIQIVVATVELTEYGWGKLLTTMKENRIQTLCL